MSLRGAELATVDRRLEVLDATASAQAVRRSQLRWLIHRFGVLAVRDAAAAAAVVDNCSYYSGDFVAVLARHDGCSRAAVVSSLRWAVSQYGY